jgi:hypothetical protein
LKGFDIVIHDGLFLEQKLTKGHLTIAPLVGLPYLTLAVDCKGALLPLFKGLDKHLSYFKKIPLVPSSVKGKSCVHLEMKFPLLAALKMEQIQFSFDSLFEGMSCRIKGIPLKMTRGLVKAKGNPEGLTVIADSALNATASRIRWTHDFKKDQDACLTVKSSPEPSFLESLIGEKIESYVSGSIPLEIKCYPLRQAEAIQVKAVLDHNTVKLPWIQLKKSAGLPLSLAAMVHKKKKKGWHMKVSVQGAFSARFEGEASEKGILERLEGHLKARQSYSCSYKHSPEGTFLWLRGALFDLSDAFRFASQASSPTTPRQGLTQWALQNQLARIKKATPVSSSRAALKLTPKEMLCLDLQCERLILKPGIVFSDIKGKLQGHTLNPAREWFDFSNIRWIEGRLTGQLLEISKRKKRKPVKKNRLDLQVMPGKSGHTNIVLNVQNVGAVFYSLGITNRLKEGTLHMEATQDATGLYKGICRFYGIYTDAPVLAKLLAMSSPAIFLEFLSSRLAFNTVHCELRYHEGQLLLDRIVGQGVNLGISGRGKIDFDKNTVDMEGVVIPIYWLNTLFSYVPIIGWVFGGDNGVLSAEFSLKGSIDSPKINMLPLSIFKLGFMKSLFENTPDFNIENRPGILKSSEEPSEPAENAEPSEEDLE